MPTEAQWEYACRAGTVTPFHYGTRLDSKMANFDGNHPYGGAALKPFRQTTLPVGQFTPNAYGLYDMHGNVWEWCLDWYGDYPKDIVVTDPLGPDSGRSHVKRGGSWNHYAVNCRSAYRGQLPPIGMIRRSDARYFPVGFRIVRVLP